MALPIEISPNPLVTSAVELRFVSEIDRTKILPVVYRKFQDLLPNLRESAIPQEIKKMDPQLKYSPDFILSNDDYSLAFSNNVVLFENVSDYKLWGNYFPFIKICLSLFFELGIIKVIERIGVRYASVFDGTKILDVVNEVPALKISGYEQKLALHRVELKNDDFNFNLQIANNAKVTKSNKVLSGGYIDIDAVYSQEVVPDKSIFEIIDKLHVQQKTLFFDLLKKTFLETLNVRYQ